MLCNSGGTVSLRPEAISASNKTHNLLHSFYIYLKHLLCSKLGISKRLSISVRRLLCMKLWEARYVLHLRPVINFASYLHH